MKKSKILIVDDYPDTLIIMSMMLHLLDHQVVSVNCGMAALDVARSFLPDTVILDIGLPDISGYEVAAMLRCEHGPDMYIVAFSGWGQPEDVERALAAGCDRHVTKPISTSVLRELVRGREYPTGT